jgi:hypothetical protein
MAVLYKAFEFDIPQFDHMSPSKDFEKLDHKNAIKHENKGPLPRFSHNPSNEFKNDCPQFGNRFQTGFVILPNEIYFALQ